MNVRKKGGAHMALKQAMPVHRKRAGRGLVACVVIIAILLAALGALSVYAALSISEQQRQMDLQAQQLAEMSAAVSQAQSEAEAQRQQMESQMEEKNQQIGNMQSTISSLQSQIAMKKSTTRTPQQIYQNLPLRQYGDYTGKKIVALTFDDGPGP